MSAADPEANTTLDTLSSQRPDVVVMADMLSVYGQNPAAVRLIREIALQQRQGEGFSRLVLIENPKTEIPDLLYGDCELVTPTLPTVDELLEELADFLEQREGDEKPERRYSIASAVAGLDRHQANRLFNLCWVENELLDVAWLRKQKAIKVTEQLKGAISFENEAAAEVGGLDVFKGWLKPRCESFNSAKARAFGLPEPKGVLCVGIPGCGKSLSAKEIARSWGLPLIRLDIGKVMGSLVGQSEQQIRAALAAAEACAPAVLWVDESEKGLAGSSGGGGDSGVGQRVFGTLLTWLQEKTAPVFVVATANKIENLPPELLRKGRFDEIFFVDLPNVEERETILGIHLARRDRKLTKSEVTRLVKASEGYSGAELEQAVIDGLFTAFADKARKLKVGDVEEALKNTSPISKTMEKEITALRKWATSGRARLATAPLSVVTSTPRRRRRGASV
jgi:hypothetical protein